jgi:PqqD family protein of HPr-rel-A system
LSGTGTDHPTAPSCPEHWRLAPGQRLRRRQWQDEYVLYNDLSGDTHMLPDSTVELLLALQRAPASAESLAGRLRAVFEDDAAAIDAAAIEALLAELAPLALVEPLP